MAARDRARSLRLEGRSLNSIATELGVSKSTAGRWLKGVVPQSAAKATKPSVVSAQAIPPDKPSPFTRGAMIKAFSKGPAKEFRSRFGRALNLDRIESALRAAECGDMTELTDVQYESINVDPHLASVLSKRFGAISTLEYDVLPAKGEGIDHETATFFASFVRNQISSITRFKQAIRQLAWGFFHGRAALEIDWRAPEKNSDTWRVAGLSWIHPRRLGFGSERELRLDPSSSSIFGRRDTGIALRDYRYKFVEFLPQLFGEYPEREGLGPRCLYWSFFKRFGMRERMILLELFGKPWRIIEVEEESTADDDDLVDADEIVQKLGSTNSARMPRGTKLRVVAPSRSAGQIHEDVVQESDRQISKLVLGQTGTTEAGGNVPGADGVLKGEQLVILQNDADLLSEAIESFLTDSIIAVNFGEEFLDHAPKFRLRSDVPKDKQSEIARLAAALEAGLEVDIEEAYALSGFTRPEPGAIILRIDQPPPHPSAVQPPPPRAVIVYPTAPEPGEIKSVPSSGQGGLESPEEIPDPPAPPASTPPPEGSGEKPETDPDEPTEDEEATAASFKPTGKVLADLVEAVGEQDAKELWAATQTPDPWDFGIDDHVCCAKQPESVNGSPEPIIAAGVRAGASRLEKWVSTYASAVRGKTAAREVTAALKRARRRVETDEFETVTYERLLHASMLGALDSDYEVRTDNQVDAVDLVGDSSPRFSKLAFEKALKAFLAKEVVSPEVFKAMEKAAKRAAFTVANAANDELLRIFRLELARQIAKGGQLRSFEQAIEARAESAGWTPANPSHVETVYRTNVVDSYGAGRFEHARQPEVVAERPYWQIRTVKDTRQRKSHREVDGFVLAADDSFWGRAYPPFGFNCRCRVTTLSAKQVASRGLEIRDGSSISGLPDSGFSSGR